MMPGSFQEPKAGLVDVATGLLFPEGPVALPDGSVLVSEGARPGVTRIAPDGAVRRYAVPGTPTGCALGPDGRLYICNSGGTTFRTREGVLEPYRTAEDYQGGYIQRIDLETGEVERLYETCDGRRLSSPNDLVFDAEGGFYFTDIGQAGPRQRDRGGIYYALADGSAIREAAHPMETPNGIGLSPDGRTVYVAETITGRLYGFEVIAPGDLRVSENRYGRGRLVAGLPGLQCFDSLAVQADGAICVATLVNGGITRVAPDGSTIEHIPMPDSFTTNICFGGPDLMTAYVTLSSTGRLVACPWDAPGLRLVGP